MDDAAFEAALAGLRDDRTSGAAELLNKALEIAARSAEATSAGDGEALIATLCERADRLRQVRPSMTPLWNAVGTWRAEVAAGAGKDLSEIRTASAASAWMISERAKTAVAAAATHAVGLIGRDWTVFTHSLSSSVLRVFELLKDNGVRAIVTEARPLCEGRITAERLAGMGIPVTLVTDAAAGAVIAQADIVLLGADTVLADGTVINKTGSYLVALAAWEAGTPVYVVADSFKWRRDGSVPELEEMDANELGHEPVSGVTILNPYFERIPAGLIGAWITEDGVLREVG